MPQTALAFDPTHAGHTTSGHPENHERLTAVWSRLQQSGLTDQVVRVSPTTAPWEAIERVHSRAYVASLRGAHAERTIWLDPDTYMTPESLEIALRAAGGTLGCVDLVMSGVAANAFALNRPPGHHATPSRAMGFCLFNHIALAARHAQRQFGAQRVAIVDFDVHHGNGTQDAFYADESVLFVSLHQSPLYPGTGDAEERGEGPGLGSTINLPLPAGCSDATHQEAFRRVVVPALDRFKPDLLLVSAGYDSHWKDPLANMRVSVSGFATMVRTLLESADRLCDGRLVACLEGGYDLAALPLCVEASLTLLLDPAAEIRDPLGCPPVQEPDVRLLLDTAAQSLRLL